MVSIDQAPTRETLKHIHRIQAFTIAWMSVEAALSVWAAWKARSPALAAFGGDSAVELMSASVVLWRFVTHASDHAEQRAARIAGVLLFALIGCVVFTSAMSLFGYSEPKPSYLGMAVLVGAAIIMPVLAKEKRRLSPSLEVPLFGPMPPRVHCARTFQSSLLWVLWFARFGTSHGPTRRQLWRSHHSLRLRLGRPCVARLVVVVKPNKSSHA